MIIAKRFADWFEKLSIAAVAVGLFQGHENNLGNAAITTSDVAIITGGAALLVSVGLSFIIGLRGKK